MLLPLHLPTRLIWEKSRYKLKVENGKLEANFSFLIFNTKYHDR